MKRYRKKPVVIKAVQYNGTNRGEIFDFVYHGLGAYIDADAQLMIRTLEGPLTASPGDWIIEGVKGEHYPCKPDVFEATYEEVTDGSE